MRSFTAAPALAIVCATAPLASARTVHPVPETDDDRAADAVVIAADAEPHGELALGLGFGVWDFGSATVEGRHLAAEGGVRFGRLELLGEYELASLGMSAMNGAALMQRIGGNARFGLASLTGATYGVGGRTDVFVEGGAGIQHVHWDGGGTQDRPDVSTGFGVAIAARGPHHHAGVTIDFRATFASPASAESVARACSGSCAPVAVRGLDQSYLLSLMFGFGG